MKKRIYSLIALFFIILLILAILSFRDKSIHNLSNNTVVSIEDLHSENIINDTSFYKIYGVSRHDSYPNALNVSIVNISEEIDKVELFNNKGERLKIEDFTINRNTLNLTIKDLDTEENDAFYLKLYNKAGDFKKINLVENSNTVIKQNGYTDCKIITRIIEYQDGKMVKEYTYSMYWLKRLILFICFSVAFWILMLIKIFYCKIMKIKSIDKLIKINTYIIPLFFIIYLVCYHYIPLFNSGYSYINFKRDNPFVGNLFYTGILLLSNFVLLILEYCINMVHLDKDKRVAITLLVPINIISVYAVLKIITIIAGNLYI